MTFVQHFSGLIQVTHIYYWYYSVTSLTIVATGQANTEIRVINQLELDQSNTDTVAVDNQSRQASDERKYLKTF